MRTLSCVFVRARNVLFSMRVCVCVRVCVRTRKSKMVDLSNTWFGVLQDQANLNNSWSAEQAQKQMDFQERMSNTAHQREVADLKAAGLNPVLSARLGGASTPSGASGTADTSIVSSMVQLMDKMLDVQGTSAAAAYNASGGSNYTSSVDSPSVTAEDVVEGVLDAASSPKGVVNAVKGFVHGIAGRPKAKYDNTAAYAAGSSANRTYNEVKQNSQNVKVIDRKTGTTKKPGFFSNLITTVQRAITGSNRKIK